MMIKGYPRNSLDGKQLDELREVLSSLQRTVVAWAEEGVERGDVVPTRETRVSPTVESFSYTESGPRYQNVVYSEVEEETWTSAISILVDRACGETEYDQVRALVFEPDEREPSRTIPVNRFLHRSLSRVLPPTGATVDLEDLVESFADEVSGKPPRHRFVVRLQGIVPMVPEIRLDTADTKILLRQLGPEDLEEVRQPGLYSWTFPPKLSDRATAILELEQATENLPAFQRVVEKCITILRLYDIGGVHSPSHQLSSDSFFSGPGATWGSAREVFPPEKYVIRRSDLPELQRFWKALWDRLPSNVGHLGERRDDFLSIAFERYSHSLIEGGKLDKRIADAVMALEALFFGKSERMELSQRLSLRIAAAFGAMGLDPHEIKRDVKRAYGIRSRYVHGSTLSYRQMKKLDDDYGSASKFLMTCLDMVRKSLLLFMLGRRQKDAALDLIDEALIDGQRRPELEGWVRGLKELLDLP